MRCHRNLVFLQNSVQQFVFMDLIMLESNMIFVYFGAIMPLLRSNLLYIYIYIYTHIYTCTFIVCVCVCVCVCLCYTHIICTYICIHTCRNIQCMYAGPTSAAESSSSGGGGGDSTGAQNDTQTQDRQYKYGNKHTLYSSSRPQQRTQILCWNLCKGSSGVIVGAVVGVVGGVAFIGGTHPNHLIFMLSTLGVWGNEAVSCDIIVRSRWVWCSYCMVGWGVVLCTVGAVYLLHRRKQKNDDYRKKVLNIDNPTHIHMHSFVKQ